MAENPKFSIPRLNNQNYQIWKYKAELLLIKEELWDVVCRERPTTADTTEWQIKDGKARATIGLLLEDNQLGHVRKETTARGTWEALRKFHEKATLSNKVSLLRKICSLKLAEEGDMELHIQKMEDLIDQLSALGEELAQNMCVAFLLSSLPESYSTLITALETRPEADLTIELVKNRLLEEHTRRKESCSMQASQDNRAYKVQTEERHTQQKTKDTCYFCKRPGHFKKSCRKYLSWKEKNTKHKANKVSHNEEGDSEGNEGSNGQSHICFQIGQIESKGKWYIDSGATAHMCSDRDFFDNLDENFKEKITLADGQILLSHGRGEGFLDCYGEQSSSTRVKLKNVLFVPELKGNLLSVRTLTNLDFTVNFKGNKCEIMHSDQIVALADMKHSLYELRIKVESALGVKELGTGKHNPMCIHAWHRRLGHREPQAIRKLEKENLAAGIKINDCNIKEVCQCCVESKLARKPFPKFSENRSQNLLDLIHTDICGPMQTTTPSGKRYVLTVIDDCSRYTVIYLLENKSETTAKIQEYVQHVRTKFGKIPKKIRSDGGKEYFSAELSNFLKREGIQREISSPYTPEQNGVAERKNRSLVEMTRCMLTDAKLHNRFWGEAVHNANHLQNRLPTRACEVTPYEIWHGHKPNLSYIRRFGCTAFVKIPDVHRRKLDPKSIKMTFAGYEEGCKGYRLLDTTTNKVKVSRDVYFIETDASGELTVNNDEIFSEENDADKEITENSLDLELVKGTNSIEFTNDEQHSELRRSQRINKGKPPERLIQSMILTQTPSDSEPKNRTEALRDPDANHWIKAMDEEIEAMKENKTWVLTPLPEGRRVIGSKWVFKRKIDASGNVIRHRARLVAQGYSQKFGEDYDEVFAPVVKPCTVRLLLTIAGKQNMAVRHYDIQTAYLNADLEHEVYMKQPDGYSNGNPNDACKLLKNIYGLKQGANEWNKKLHITLSSKGFTQSKNDPCLYSKNVNGQWLYVVVHVDDVIAAAPEESMLDNFENSLSAEFQIVSLGELTYYLGIKFQRNQEGFFSLNQAVYIKRKLREFNLEESKISKVPMDPGYLRRAEIHDELKTNEVYRRAIGSLLYVATNSRPDIAVSTSILARKVEHPRECDWIEVKRIFRYLKGTIDFQLKLGDASVINQNLIGYVDSDWGGDVVDRKSNTGYFFSYLGGTISWKSKRQQTVSLSSTEAEFIAFAEALQEAIWIKRLLSDFHEATNDPIKMREDNQSCIKLLKNCKISQRTKHIDTKYHFAREMCRSGQVEIEYCPSEQMTADLLTKPLEAVKTRKFVKDIGLLHIHH